MNTLIGSEKQVKWAMEIREGVLDLLATAEEMLTTLDEGRRTQMYLKVLKNLRTDLEKTTQAHWIINKYKNISYKEDEYLKFRELAKIADTPWESKTFNRVVDLLARKGVR